MKHFLARGIALTLILSIVSCGMLQPNSLLTQQQKESQVKSVAATAIFAAITSTYDESAKRAKKARELKAQIEDNVLPILFNPDATLDSTTEQLLFSKIPAQYRVYVTQAVNVLRLYYTTPQVGELLTPEDAQLLLALFQGIARGCDLVIEVASE